MRKAGGALGFILLVLGVVLVATSSPPSKLGKALKPVPTQVVQPSPSATPMPTPTPVGAPTRIAIPKIGVDAPVEMVGIEVGASGKKSLGVPKNPDNAAWATFSSRPGEPGGSLIDGHLDYPDCNFCPDRLRVFARLSELAPGDEVFVTTETGQKIKFLVSGTGSMPYNTDIPTKLYARDGPSRLSLITCVGAYTRATGYSDRLYVYANLAN